MCDLGASPLCESFLTAGQLNQMEPFYPLRADVCEQCWLVQLESYVAPEAIFTEYAYFSSTRLLGPPRPRLHRAGAERLGLGPDSLVVELASNDGYLLAALRGPGIPVLGSSRPATWPRRPPRAAVPTLTEFFGEELAGRLAAEGRRPDLIAANNVLAQVPDLNSFVAGIARLLKPTGGGDGRVPHLVRLMEGNQFDTSTTSTSPTSRSGRPGASSPGTGSPCSTSRSWGPTAGRCGSGAARPRPAAR